MIAEQGVPDGPLAAWLAQPTGGDRDPPASGRFSALSDILGVPVNAGEFLTVTLELCEILGCPDGEAAVRRLRDAEVLTGQRRPSGQREFS